MRFIRTKAVIATVGLALSLAACGDAGDDGGEATDVEVLGHGDVLLTLTALRRWDPEAGIVTTL